MQAVDVTILGRIEGPVVDEDAREWEKSVGYHLFSPTQITTFIECPRKWAWRRIAHIHTPQNASAELGSRVHKVLEDYLGEGKRPDFVADRVAAEIASSGLHLLPTPKTPGMQLEQEFRFQSPRTSFVYHGFKDVSLAPGVAIPALEIDGTAPVVIDHKSTKSIGKWAKTDDDLRYDAQSTLYAYDAMARYMVPAADLAWIYYQTEGARRASPTKIRLTSKQAAPVFDEIERVATEAATALEKKLQPLDLAPNPDMCRAYGGCPYRHLCTDLITPSQILRSRMSNSTIASLRARVQGTATSTPSAPPAPAATPTPAPSVMGCEDKDVPAPTEIPPVFAGPPASEATVAINPPEGSIPPAPVQATAEPEKPKRAPRTKKAPEPPRDPIGADAMATTPEPSAAVTCSDAKAQETVDKVVVAVSAETEKAVRDTLERINRSADVAEAELARLRSADEAQAREGFTLYVDCIPIGRPAKAASTLIAKAQERMLIDGPRDAAGQPVPDYRLVDYGKGAPAFVAFVVDQIDGTFDLALDTRSPEGALLLEPLMGKATFVVRGLR